MSVCLYRDARRHHPIKTTQLHQPALSRLLSPWANFAHLSTSQEAFPVEGTEAQRGEAACPRSPRARRRAPICLPLPPRVFSPSLVTGKSQAHESSPNSSESIKSIYFSNTRAYLWLSVHLLKSAQPQAVRLARFGRLWLGVAGSQQPWNICLGHRRWPR